MRSVLTLLVILCGIASCAPVNEMCAHNEQGMGVACRSVFGYDYEGKEMLAKHEGDIQSLKTRVSIIEANIQSLFFQADLLTKQIQIDNDLLNVYSASSGTMEIEVTNVLNSISSLQTQIVTLQTQVNNQLTQLVSMSLTVEELQANVHVVEVYDFCGNKPGHLNEVGLKLSNGKIMAYFEGNDGERLIVLNAGSYVTTDGTNCHFTVNANGEITNEHY